MSSLKSSDFEFLNILGKGSSGIVYKALKKNTQELFAIKSTSRLLNDLFEIELLEKLKHPNIVQLIGFYTSEQNIFMIMEYCHKGSLDKAGILAETEASTFIGQVYECQMLKKSNHFRSLKDWPIYMTKVLFIGI